jgi:adenylate kinase
MLREAVISGSELGRRVKGIMERGELVPDSVVIELVKQRLGQGDARDGFILDGFPRTCEQARALDTLLESLRRQPPVAVALEAPDAELVQRILGRGEGRSDDTEAVVQRRLQVYRSETASVLEHYRDALIRVHGVGSIEDIQTAILEALGA